MIALPEIVTVGSIEYLFIGMAFGAGFPKLARRALAMRYPGADVEDDK